MTPALAPSQQALFSRIVDALKKGGALNDEILDYVDAALFTPEPDRLSAFLADDEDSERDTLLDLIFYPDRMVQIDLEPILASGRYSAEDERTILESLLAITIEPFIRLPDGRLLTRIQLPDFIRTRYLERLNITWQLPAGLAAAIDKGVSAVMGPVVRVRLRNAGMQFSAGQVTFLCRFFERMDDSHPDYPACLDLALALLDKKGSAAMVYDLLVDYKRVCFRAMEQARRFTALLRRSNMETLMLQGFQPPRESPEVLLHRMGLIDRICFSVFGRTEPMAPAMEEPPRQGPDLDDPAAAVQWLLR
ncbi:hypothetical protein DSCW_47720 [Desulfosarcina widdelii]|uniref:Uncharacterized protein n=1 Tax=Desulfosarcina widdelii TaxID=947919 RepID=A0A5K7Z9I0_9BACT|nr:hypothetical protein [Desulfosarcina widdelii]BBO77355.1 hypothetical protein DSCW_47720 [Desulfosarcina widdelii]